MTMDRADVERMAEQLYEFSHLRRTGFYDVTWEKLGIELKDMHIDQVYQLLEVADGGKIDYANR